MPWSSRRPGPFGGSTARSGGGIWAPGNSVLRAAGVADTPEQARAYLAHVAEGRSGRAAARRCSSTARRCSAWSCAKTPVRFAWVPGYADYYPEAPRRPGRGAQYRARSARRTAGARRGTGPPRAPYLRLRRWPSPRPSTGGSASGLGIRRGVLAAAQVAGRAARARLLGQRMLSMGQALAAGLRAGLVASGVPVWLDTPLTGPRGDRTAG